MRALEHAASRLLCALKEVGGGVDYFAFMNLGDRRIQQENWISSETGLGLATPSLRVIGLTLFGSCGKVMASAS